MRWVNKRAGLLVWAGAATLLAACVAPRGGRPTLPTAMPAVQREEGSPIPALNAVQASQSAGPTSTAAPWATPIPPPPPPPARGITHDLIGKADCLYCHNTPASFGIPRDHARRSNATCLGCHALSLSAPQPTPRAMPHPIDGLEGCLLCHLQGDNGASIVPADHARRTNDVCISCHHAR
jgi:hypothetical protein